MASPLQNQPTDFERMTLDEQCEYFEKHADDLLSAPPDDDVPMWHRELLAERLKHYREMVEGGITWEEFKKELIEKGLFKS